MRFLERVVRHSKQHFGDLSSVLFVLPGRRAGTFLKKYILEMDTRTQWSPRVVSFNELAAEHTEWELADSIALRFELYKVYCQIKKNPENFTAFDAWGSIILSDYNAIDNYLVDAKSVYSDLRNIRDIEEWSYNLDPLSEDQKKFLAFWDILGVLHEKFRDALMKEGLAYSGMLMRHFAENLDSLLPDTKVKIVFAGFNALSKAEVKVIQHYQKYHDAQVFWDVDPFYMDEPQHPAGHFVRKVIRKLGSSAPLDGASKINHKAKVINLVAVSNPLAQCRMIGEVLSAQDKDSNIAIVLADENLLFPLLESLPKGIDRINITMGLSFLKSPLYKVFSSVISIHIYALKRWSGKETYSFYHKDFVQCMQELIGLHPYLLEAGVLEEVLLDITRKNRYHIDEAYLRKQSYAEKLEHLLFVFHAIGNDVNKLTEILLKLARLLIEDEKLDALNKEIAMQFEKMLNSFNEVNMRYGYIDNLLGFQNVFRQIVASEKLAFIGEPLGGVQIMGMLETRAIDFDKVMLIGANEGVLPATRKPNSFFPHELKGYYGLPSFKDHEAVYAYYFYRLIQYAPEVHIVYGLERDDFGGGGEKSRFVNQIEYESKNNRLACQLNFKEYQLDLEQEDLPEVVIQKNTEIVEHLTRQLTGGGLSPSALGRYVSCPLDFYYRYVLGLGEVDTLEDEINNADLGTCVHGALEKLYEPYIGEVLTSNMMTNMKSLVDKEVESLFKENGLQEAIRSGVNHLIFMMARKMVQVVVDWDISRIKKGDQIKIIGLEQKYKAALPMPVADGMLAVQLRGIVDRVEEVNGVVHIIDYKSGKVVQKDMGITSNESLLKKSKALQLTQYMWLYHQQNPSTKEIVCSIMSLPKSTNHLMSLSYGKVFSKQEDLLGHFSEVVQTLVSDMLGLDVGFQHDPKAQYCDYCQNVKELSTGF